MTNIYATFEDPKMAEKAGGALLDHGVKPEHLSLVFPEGYKSTEDEANMETEKMNEKVKSGITTTTAADAGRGSMKGAGWGLAAGAVAALASVFVPGVGLVVGGGALAIAIGEVAAGAAGGAIVGGVVGFLDDQGVPKQATNHYRNTLAGGGAILTVWTADEKVADSKIEAILVKYHGVFAAYPDRVSVP